MYVLFAIFALVVGASAKDLIVGHEGGRLIYEQNVTASPAIWRQDQNVTVNASDFEVITRVVVIDNREDKNGEAAVVEGGEGLKTVIVELKSPAIFRGFDFTVKVYAKSEDGIQKPTNDDVQQNVQSQNDFKDFQAPEDEKEHDIQGTVSPVQSSSSTQSPNTQGQEQHQQTNDDQQNVQSPNSHDFIQGTVSPVLSSSSTQSPNIQDGVQHQNTDIEQQNVQSQNAQDFIQGTVSPVLSSSTTKSPNSQEKEDQQTNVEQQNAQKPSGQDFVQVSVTPVLASSTTPAPNTQEVQHPVVISTDDQQEVQRPSRDTNLKVPQKSETEQKVVDPTPVVNDVQTAQSASEGQVQENKGLNNKDFQEVIDKIFEDNNDTQGNVEPSIQHPTYVSNDEDFDQLLIDINGGVESQQQSNQTVLPLEVAASTAKSVEDQQAVQQQAADSQQIKEQLKVPLPYVKH